MLSKNFSALVLITMQKHFPQNIFFPNFFCWVLVLPLTIVLMNWISRSFNISIFISSRLKLFGCIDVLKKIREVHSKVSVLECILIKMLASNLQYEILIKKEKGAHMLSCEFCESFKTNIFFTEQLRAPVILILLKYDFQFLSTLHQPSSYFREFTKLNKFGIVGK